MKAASRLRPLERQPEQACGVEPMHRGQLTLEVSAFAVDGADGLSMVVFTPMTPDDVRAIEALLARTDQAA